LASQCQNSLPGVSFYVIVGSAARALIGLQFTVVTLIAQKSTTARSN
jgi:hypothetical protein